MADCIAAVVLAAGRSSRAGAVNKLLVDLQDKPMIAHVVDVVLNSPVTSVTVVTGHDAEAVETALRDRDVRFVHNPHHTDGMGSSVATGARSAMAVPPGMSPADGLLILLGDMPWVHADHVRTLVEAFRRSGGACICAPTHAGRRGNPVLWPRRYLPALTQLTGDRGGRALLTKYATDVEDVAMDDDGVLRDVDTADDVADVGWAERSP